MVFSCAASGCRWSQYRQPIGPAHPDCDEPRPARDELPSARTNGAAGGALASREYSPSMEADMADRQQRGNKEAKKPKKDSGPPKPVTPLAPVPTTAVLERGKKKNK
jgi:hypothetical protein